MKIIKTSRSLDGAEEVPDLERLKPNRVPCFVSAPGATVDGLIEARVEHKGPSNRPWSLPGGENPTARSPFARVYGSRLCVLCYVCL